MDKAMASLRRRFEPEEYRFQLAARWIPRNVLQADPGNIGRVELRDEVSRYTNFGVSIQTGNEIKEIEIQLSVIIERKLPVLNKRLQSTTVIAAEDISVRWISVREIEQNLANNPKAIAGKTLRNTILAGQPVQLDQLSSKILVEAGASVQLIFEQTGIRVVINGEARQSGAKNEEITIYSKETRKTYRGRIIAPGITKWVNTK